MLEFKRNSLDKSVTVDHEIWKQYGYISFSIPSDKFLSFEEIQKDFNQQVYCDFPDVTSSEFLLYTSPIWQFVALLHLIASNFVNAKIK